MRVLIVDDETAIVSLLKEWLTERGHEAFELATAVRLPGWVAEHEYDVLFLDVHLRGANGLWFISQVHAAAPKMTIIVMSGDDDPAVKKIALQEGASHYVSKPLDIALLDGVLQEIMDEKSRT